MTTSLRLSLLALLLCVPVRADEKPAFDPVKLEGKSLRKVNSDDALLLGVISRGVLNQAVQGTPLTDEARRLLLPGMRAFQNKEHDAAYRYASRLILLHRGETLGEGTELATSYDFQLDRKLVAPGEPLHVLLQPLFTLGGPLAGEYTARLSLASGEGKAIEKLPAVTIKEVADLETAVPTKGLKAGRYRVDYELVSPANKVLVSCSREFLVDADAGKRLESLQKQIAKLREEKPATASRATALETVEYVAEVLDRARKQYVGPMLKCSTPMTTKLRGLDLTRIDSEPFELARDLPLAEEFAAALLAGKDPLANRNGDIRLAYRSAVDRTLQPFRVHVPKSYDSTKPMPLIVALHGATGDENTYMDRYVSGPKRERLFPKLGEERGYLLATPNGRGAFGLYQGDSEKDVLEVLDRVQKVYAVNPKQVFLTGHSMGGAGTWVLGFKHPERFAALAPVAGRPMTPAAIDFKKAPEMPVLFAGGTKDVLVTPAVTRELAERAKKELKHFQYVETDDDHFRIGVTSMPGVFDFFDRCRGVKPPEPKPEKPAEKDRVKEVSLKDIRGGKRTLEDWKDRKAVVLVFLGADCPLSNLYAVDLQKMAKAWQAKGVAFEGVHTDPETTAETATEHAKEHGLSFPLLLDTEQRLTRSLGIRVTPEAVVLSSSGVVLYRGRIDDRYTEDGIRRDGPQVRDLEAAVEAVLEGKAPAKAEVPGFGCPLPRAPASKVGNHGS